MWTLDRGESRQRRMSEIDRGAVTYSESRAAGSARLSEGMEDILRRRVSRRVGNRHLSIDELIEAAVVRTIEQCLLPYLAKLGEPEPLVYTAAQAAAVLQVSPDTIGRLLKRGVLTRVPHLNGKLLIPRTAVDRLVHDQNSDDAGNDDHPAIILEVSSLPGPEQRRRASGP